MAGQIIKRGDNTWLVRVFTGRDADGKRRYINKTVKGRRKDAQAYLSETLTKISTGTFIEPVKLTLKEYLDEWLDTAVSPRVRERTLSDYKEKIERYIQPALGNQKVSDLRPLDVQRFYSDLQGRGLSSRTIRYVHSILSSSLKQAVKWYMLSRNVCDAVELPRNVREEMQALSPEQANRFLEAAAKNEQGIVFGFALATGMRPEEYLALKWSDIDLEKGTATIRRTLVWRKGGGWYFGEPKTPRSRRTVPLPATLVRSLIAHRRTQAEARLKLGQDYQNNNLVFAAREGTPHNLGNLTRRHFRPILTKAGTAKDGEQQSEISELWPERLNKLRVYDLRHSCATLLLAAGENPKVVSERLGHASIVLTLDIYSHVLPSMQQAATEKLERILFGT
jgi:integrase